MRVYGNLAEYETRRRMTAKGEKNIFNSNLLNLTHGVVAQIACIWRIGRTGCPSVVSQLYNQVLQGVAYDAQQFALA